MKLSECLEEFLNALNEGKSVYDRNTGKTWTIETPVAPNTMRTYKRILDTLILVIGNKELEKFSLRDCQIFYNVPKFTVKTTPLIVVHRFLDVQRILGRINSNPMKEFRESIQTGGRSSKKDTYYISAESLKKLVLHTIETGAMYLGTGIQGCMGLRSAEVHGNEIDYTEEEISRMSRRQKKKLIHGLTWKDGIKIAKSNEIVIKGKGEKVRRTLFFHSFIGDKASSEFLSYITNIAEERSKDEKDDRLVPSNTQAFNEWLKEKQKQLSIEVLSKQRGEPTNTPLTSHILRHCFGVIYVERGGNLEDLKELMGHESIETTQIYSKATKTRIDKEYARIEGSEIP